MNIFHVDIDPQEAAKALADRHVGKMLLESCQMMSTAAREHGYDGNIYKSAYQNHPATKWAALSYENYRWLWHHAMALSTEFEHRFGKPHKSSEVLPELGVAMMWKLPRIGFTIPPQCMPNEFKRDDYVDGYREYYKHGKSHLHKWTKRRAPSWLRGDNA
jgi:hypothetical protein